ncbi:MAG: hypothetical protein GY793_05705 [Proteobacteria bacterium]|nr:hypothetical protein [Pseudomonadota bacterium]
MYRNLINGSTPEAFIKVGKFAVIDMGSNSFRLCIFDDVEHYPHQYILERYKTKLAEGKGKDGFVLKEEKIEEALRTLRWFDWICKQQCVENVVVVATSAIREAENGSDLVRRAKEELGVVINVIDGDNEARLSALGASKSIRNAQGLVIDLGGGSLEIFDTETKHQKSLPLGILTLKELTNNNPQKAVEILKKELAKDDWIVNSKGNDIIANGGGMRSIALMHMKKVNHPIWVPQGYIINSVESLNFIESLFYINDFSDIHTGDDVVYRGALLKALFELSPKLKQIKFSNFGLREGLLFSHLKNKNYNLLEMYCKNMSKEKGFGFDYARNSYKFVKEIIPEVNQEVLYYTALVKDICWRVHKQYRADVLFEQLLTLDFVGVGHYLRAMIALSGSLTQGKKLKQKQLETAFSTLSKEDVLVCKMIGEIYKLTELLNPARDGDFSSYNLSRNGAGIEMDINPEVEEIIHLGLQERLKKVNGFINEFNALCEGNK